MRHQFDRGIFRGLAFAGLLGITLAGCDDGSVGDDEGNASCEGAKCDETEDEGPEDDGRTTHRMAVEACGTLDASDDDAVDDHMNCVGQANETFAFEIEEAGGEGFSDFFMGYRQARFQLCGAMVSIDPDGEDLQVMHCAAVGELDLANLIDAHADLGDPLIAAVDGRDIEHLAGCYADDEGRGDRGSPEAVAALVTCLQEARFDYEDEHIVGPLQEADPEVDPSELARIWDMIATATSQSTDGVCGTLAATGSDRDPATKDACRRDAEIALSKTYLTFAPMRRVSDDAGG